MELISGLLNRLQIRTLPSLRLKGAGVSTLFGIGYTYREYRETERGRESFRMGKGVVGPKSYDSRETLVLYILYVLYSLYGRNIKLVYPTIKMQPVKRYRFTRTLSLDYLLYTVGAG